MATATLAIKQGATLQLLIRATNDDGTPLDVSTVTVSATVRNQYNREIAMLSITPTGIPGQLAIAQDTSTWDVGQLMCDFKFVQGNLVLKSDTFVITVLQPVTV